MIKCKLGTEGTLSTISDSDYLVDTTNNEIIITDLILSDVLSYTEQGRMYLFVNNLLTSDSEYHVVAVGIPVFDYGEHDLQINGDFFIADRDRKNPVNVKEKLDSLVVDNLDGDTTEQAPSIRAVNEAFSSIVESKSTGSGYYVKYSDGTMICTALVTVTSNLSDYWGQFKRTEEHIPVSFPTPFSNIPIVVVTGTNYEGIVSVLIGDRLQHKFKFTALKPNANNGTNYGIVRVVKGGTKLEYTTIENGWYKLSYGYISSKAVKGNPSSPETTKTTT